MLSLICRERLEIETEPSYSEVTLKRGYRYLVKLEYRELNECVWPSHRITTIERLRMGFFIQNKMMERLPLGT